jgi:hypothetical protein
MGKYEICKFVGSNLISFSAGTSVASLQVEKFLGFILFKRFIYWKGNFKKKYYKIWKI